MASYTTDSNQAELRTVLWIRSYEEVVKLHPVINISLVVKWQWELEPYSRYRCLTKLSEQRKKERRMALSLQHTFVFSCLPHSFWALTVFTRSNAVATIYFIMQFCVASNQERRLLNSVLSAKSFINARSLRKASFIKFNSSHMTGCDKHQFSDKMTKLEPFSRYHCLTKWSEQRKKGEKWHFMCPNNAPKIWDGHIYIYVPSDLICNISCVVTKLG